MTQTNYAKEYKIKNATVDTEARTLKGVFSTMVEDRHGEVVDQLGWNLKEYMLNPVVLFGHDHNRPSIGKVVELAVTQNGLEGVIEFADTPLAKEIFSLYAGGYMSAFSCGFRNDVYEYDTENDKVVLRNNTLYEVSCVNVPANAYALAKSKGLELKEIANPLGKLEIATATVGAESVVEKSIDAKVVAPSDVKEATEQIKTVVEKSLAEVGNTKAKTKDEMLVALVNKAVKSLLATKRTVKNY
jgi:HK97 family phage prohead protease